MAKKKIPQQKRIDLFEQFAKAATYYKGEYRIAVGETLLIDKSPRELFIKYKAALGLLN